MAQGAQPTAQELPTLELPGAVRPTNGELQGLLHRVEQDVMRQLTQINTKLDQLDEVKTDLKDATMKLSGIEAKMSRMQVAGLALRRRPSLQSLRTSRSIASPRLSTASMESAECCRQTSPNAERMPPPILLARLSTMSPRSTGSTDSSSGSACIASGATSAWAPPGEPCHTAQRKRGRFTPEICSSDMVRVLSHFSRSDRATRVWNFLEMPESSRGARLYVRCMIGIIMTSLVVTFLQTVCLGDGDPPPLRGWPAAILETAFDSAFALEVILRFAVCPNRRAFFTSAFSAIDLLAAAPLLLRAAVGFELPECDDGSPQWTVLMCVVPVIRTLKTLRHFEKFNLLLSAFGIALEALPVLLYTFFVILMIFSSLIYITEPRDNINSYSKAMWLTVVTMMTVGYGDVVPQSTGGSTVISILIVGSVLYMAIPIGIVGSAFNRVWEDRERLLLVQRTREHLIRSGYRAQDIPGLFQLFDTSRTGELCLDDFSKMIVEMKLGISEDRIFELFRSFDRDGSGAISDRELVHELFPESFTQLFGSGDAKMDEWKDRKDSI